MLAIYKQKSETPLEALHRLRKVKTEFASMSLSYAGRLDPMAEGVMLVLVGEENKNREKYLGLDKTYLTEILFGISTDTGDVLGKIQEYKNRRIEEIEIREGLGKWVGKFEQKYPAYSSKSFAGSYDEVRGGKVAEHVHEVEIYSAQLLDVTEISAEDLLKKIISYVSKVIGDFRQEEIIKKWKDELADESKNFQVAKIRLSVSSGFYVRQFAEDLGEKFGVSALAFSILREKVGEWGIDDCIV